MSLQVSEGFSIHHQEFKTVYTAKSICQRDTADCLFARWCIWFIFL